MRAIYCSSGDARAVRSLVSVVVVIDRALVWLSFPAVAEEQHIRGTQGFGASNSRALNGVGPDNAEHGVRAFGPGPKSKTHAGFYRSHAWRCAETTELFSYSLPTHLLGWPKDAPTATDGTAARRDVPRKELLEAEAEQLRARLALVENKLSKL